ncbi:MAG: TraB/GumN family protein [Chitinophagaceae bacterium]
MIKRTFFLLFICISFLSLSTVAQNKSTWPKTFLWRISGNGLSKNSFLYGTMHLQDKRLFNFSDSLYSYLEQAEGYALEIDLSEFMDSLIQKVMDERLDRKLSERTRMARGSDRKKVVDSLVENVKKRKDKASKKELEALRDEKMNAILKKEMPTIMDAFLYGIAKRQGKWLGGIEDIQDQLPLLDELGGEMDSDDLLAPPTELKKSLEKMIGVYQKKDLEEIERFYSNDISGKYKDLLLLRRNGKMAKRMDSLANIRSMFFTVGVAHLPGDSGVINLLKQRGFSVDPVFSSKTVDPIEYVSKLKTINWEKNGDDKKTYEVEMPGKASELLLLGGALKMKYYVDVTTLTFFMSGSYFAQDSMDLNKQIDNVANNNGAKILGRRMIERNGLKGIEADVFSNEAYFRMQYLLRGNIVYMLMAGGQKKEVMETADAKKFFQSFTASKEMPVMPEKEWSTLTLKEKGINVMFPGKPKRNSKIEQKANGTNWKFTVYDYTDPLTGSYYVVQVRDILPGFHMTGDSSYFSFFRESFGSVIKSSIRNELTTFESFPAFICEGEENNGVILKTILVNRGNRCYNIMVEGFNKPTSLADMDNFINSFHLSEYEESSWKKQSAEQGNFHSVVPSAFELKTKVDEDEESKEDDEIHYVSFNTSDCISYEVIKSKLSPYYSAANEKTFFEKLGESSKDEYDSIISKRIVTNGHLTGYEWVISMPDNHNLKKVRHLLNGDTLYTLIGYIPLQYFNKKSHQQFFDEFRITKEDLNPTIYKSKVRKLLTDLQSSDSATHVAAFTAFRTVTFSPADKELLQDALLKEYMDDAESYHNSRDKIIDTLSSLMDSGTVAFVQTNFPLLTGRKELLKLPMLDLLSRYKTKYSYAVLKELLVQHTPKEKGEYNLSYHLDDSLELTATLFPEILKLSNNNLFAPRVMSLTPELLDSNLISKEMLQPYERQFIYIADTTYERLSEKEELGSTYDYKRMLHLMQQFNDTGSNRVLKKYLGLSDIYLKKIAAMALLKNKQAVDPKQIEKIAADKGYRVEFYEELSELNRTDIFPAAYRTQQSMAESDIFYMSNDDDTEPEEIKFIEARTALYKGKSSRFYLFKVKYSYKDDDGNNKDEVYLGVGGPYSTDFKNLKTDSEATTVLFAETYDHKQITKQFKAHLKDLQEPSPEDN